jgi:hypothetical protein
MQVPSCLLLDIFAACTAAFSCPDIHRGALKAFCTRRFFSTGFAGPVATPPIGAAAAAMLLPAVSMSGARCSASGRLLLQRGREPAAAPVSFLRWVACRAGSGRRIAALAAAVSLAGCAVGASRAPLHAAGTAGLSVCCCALAPTAVMPPHGNPSALAMPADALPWTRRSTGRMGADWCSDGTGALPCSA